MKREIEIGEGFASMKVGPNVVVTLSNQQQKLQCDWLDTWSQWQDLQNSPELKQLIDRANDMLQKRQAAKEQGKSKHAQIWRQLRSSHQVSHMSHTSGQPVSTVGKQTDLEHVFKSAHANSFLSIFAKNDEKRKVVAYRRQIGGAHG